MDVVQKRMLLLMMFTCIANIFF